MKKVNLPKTENLLKELLELTFQSNLNSMLRKEKLREAMQQKEEEGCFSDIAWVEEDGGVSLYIDFTEKELKKIMKQATEIQAQKVFEYFKNKKNHASKL